MGRFQVRDIYGKRKASSEKKKTEKEISIAIFFIIALKKPEHAMQIELLKQTVIDHEIISYWIYFYSDFPKKTPASFIFKFFFFVQL